MRRPKVRHTLHPELAHDDLTPGGHQQHSIFLRGLSLGALVGAAIAGSAIWDRRRARRAHKAASAAPSRAGDVGST